MCVLLRDVENGTQKSPCVAPVPVARAPLATPSVVYPSRERIPSRAWHHRSFPQSGATGLRAGRWHQECNDMTSAGAGISPAAQRLHAERKLAHSYGSRIQTNFMQRMRASQVPWLNMLVALNRSTCYSLIARADTLTSEPSSLQWFAFVMYAVVFCHGSGWRSCDTTRHAFNTCALDVFPSLTGPK